MCTIQRTFVKCIFHCRHPQWRISSYNVNVRYFTPSISLRLPALCCILSTRRNRMRTTTTVTTTMCRAAFVSPVSLYPSPLAHLCARETVHRPDQHRSRTWHVQQQQQSREQPRRKACMHQRGDDNQASTTAHLTLFAAAGGAAALLLCTAAPAWRVCDATAMHHVAAARADEADVRPQLKISGGSASTSGGARSSARSVVKTVTRGVTLENADFSNADYEGISFQQSILRQADFSNSNLRNASFFDADLTGAKFINADITNVNVSFFFFLLFHTLCVCPYV